MRKFREHLLHRVNPVKPTLATIENNDREKLSKMLVSLLWAEKNVIPLDKWFFCNFKKFVFDNNQGNTGHNHVTNGQEDISI